MQMFVAPDSMASLEVNELTAGEKSMLQGEYSMNQHLIQAEAQSDCFKLDNDGLSINLVELK